MSNTNPSNHRKLTHVFAKGKQFLLLIRYPPLCKQAQNLNTRIKTNQISFLRGNRSGHHDTEPGNKHNTEQSYLILLVFFFNLFYSQKETNVTKQLFVHDRRWRKEIIVCTWSAMEEGNNCLYMVGDGGRNNCLYMVGDGGRNNCLYMVGDGGRKQLYVKGKRSIAIWEIQKSILFSEIYFGMDK
jgi:hypothetical protein